MYGLYFVVLLYVVAMYAADRLLNRGRRHLTSEDKVRLVDAATEARSRSFLPHLAVLAVIGAGLVLWPDRMQLVLTVAYAAFLALFARQSAAWYRKLQTLGVHEEYLRFWLWSRLTQFVALAGVCAYLLLDM